MIDKDSIQVFLGSSLVDAHSVTSALEHFIQKPQQSGLLLVEPFALQSSTLSELVKRHQNQLDTASLFEKINKSYFQIVEEVLQGDQQVLADINDDLIEIEWTLEDPPENNPDFVMDQILVVLAVVSSKIVAAYLSQKGISNQWLDARDLFVADNSYGNGKILPEPSHRRCRVLTDIPFGITQAGVACTTENFNVTLGEKGSEKVINFLTQL